MAGARLVEDVVARDARRVRHHDVRRRALRQLQPHPALGCARRHPRPAGHLHQPARVVRAGRRHACTPACASRASIVPSALVIGARRPGRALRPAGHRDRQHARSCRRSTACVTDTRHATATASSSSARSMIALRSATMPPARARAAVIGGGLLGLEAARGLLTTRRRSARRPPDAAPHGRPARRGVRRDAARGDGAARRDDASRRAGRRPCSATRAVNGLLFDDGSRLDCDMVVVSAGIRPNVALARDAA